MVKYYDRETKIVYVEQINAGKITVTETAKELGCSRPAIYSRMCKLSGDPQRRLDWIRKLMMENLQLYIFTKKHHSCIFLMFAICSVR
ncbi:MAG TPA: hypothetical protein VFC96_02795 [Anaerovoracaceae bacterium]|nr:hypothetical protein [Anaerovoracaceae bacterium]